MRLLKDSVKLGLDVFQAAWSKGARAVGLIDFAVPRNSSMRKTSDRSVARYYMSGIRTYLPIVTMAQHYGMDFEKPVAILDFGCGVGRQLVHLTRTYPAPRFHACDIDSDSVAFIKANYTSVDAYVNGFTPPLKYADGSLDLIYTVSTFSHFAPDDHEPWLREFHRILKPGGLCMPTTEGSVALRSLRETFADNPDLDRQLAEQGVAFREYSWLPEMRGQSGKLAVADHAKGITGSYGNTLITRDYMRRLAEKIGFEMLDVVEGIIDNRQDLVVLRKRRD